MDPDQYDYQRVARDAIHFPALVDRFWQNTDLAKALGTRAPATSAMVDRLTHAGLVSRTRDPAIVDVSS